jgi:hypothetical protein
VEHSVLWGRNLLVTGQLPWSTTAPLSSCGIDPVDFECDAAVNKVPSECEKLLEPSQERTLSSGSACCMNQSSSEFMPASISMIPPRLDERLRPQPPRRAGKYPPSLEADFTDLAMAEKVGGIQPAATSGQTL